MTASKHNYSAYFVGIRYVDIQCEQGHVNWKIGGFEIPAAFLMKDNNQLCLVQLGADKRNSKRNCDCMYYAHVFNTFVL
jgi:hypothetical protein